MGKASSAKKVARAARAGGTRRPGQRRQLGFPLLLAAVVLLGTFLVVFARSNREANASPRSQANEEFDHWHAAFGVSECGTFRFDGSDTGGAFFSDALSDPQGIHTHNDGVIHIHPFLDSAGGRNARLRIFFDDIGLEFSDSKWTFPDGTVWDEAETECGEGDEAGPSQIVIAKWNDAQEAADGERPSDIITEDFGDIRFRNDREYYTFALIPEGEFEGIAVRPEVISDLNNLSDVPADENIEAPSTTAPDDGSSTTTAPDGSSTTVTTTGEPTDGSTTTVVEPTTTTGG